MQQKCTPVALSRRRPHPVDLSQRQETRRMRRGAGEGERKCVRGKDGGTWVCIFALLDCHVITRFGLQHHWWFNYHSWILHTELVFTCLSG